MRRLIAKRTARQALACLPVLCNQFIVGLGWGWTAPSLLKLQGAESELRMSVQEVSWIVSVNEIGRIGSPIISPFIVDSLGRRYTVVLVCVLNALIWFSQAFIRNAYLLCLVRLVFGMTNGLQDVVSPVYTTENCTSEFRGVAAALMSIVFSVGKLFEILLATHLSYEMTPVANTLISICAFGALYFCVESPQYLIMKEKCADAERNLKWLQADPKPEDLAREMEKLKIYVRKEKEKRKSIKTLLSCAENVKSIFTVFIMYLISTATGGIAIGAYASIVYPSTEAIPWSYFLCLSEFTNFVTLLTTPIISAKVKTKKILLVCYSMITFIHFSTSLQFYLRAKNREPPFYPWLLFITLTSYGLLRSIAGPAHYVIRGELLPLSVRALGGSVSVMVTAATGFSIVKAFLPLTERFGMETNFLLYAVMAVFTSFQAYFCLGETRDDPLADNQNAVEGDNV